MNFDGCSGLRCHCSSWETFAGRYTKFIQYTPHPRRQLPSRRQHRGVLTSSISYGPSDSPVPCYSYHFVSYLPRTELPAVCLCPVVLVEVYVSVALLLAFPLSRMCACALFLNVLSLWNLSSSFTLLIMAVLLPDVPPLLPPPPCFCPCTPRFSFLAKLRCRTKRDIGLRNFMTKQPTGKHRKPPQGPLIGPHVDSAAFVDCPAHRLHRTSVGEDFLAGAVCFLSA